MLAKNHVADYCLLSHTGRYCSIQNGKHWTVKLVILPVKGGCVVNGIVDGVCVALMAGEGVDVALTKTKG